jgi:hypothetical protein
MDLGAIQAAITSLKAATGIAKSILETKSEIEIQGKVIELQSALLDAQSSALAATTSQFELQERIRSLEDLLKAASAWGDQEKRYALVCPWRGPAQVYALRKACSDSEAPHFLCPNCFHGKKRVILNPINNKDAFICMACPSCKATMETGYRAIGSPKYAEDYEKEN